MIPQNLPKQNQGSKPKLMGVLNLHQDSQTEMGRCTKIDIALRHAEQLLADGADYLDIGAEPTNPQVAMTSLHSSSLQAEKELEKLVPVLEMLKGFPLPISIDTSQPLVMRETVKLGAAFINDVRALRVEGAIATVAELQVPVCLMHMAYPWGFPPSGEKHPNYSQGILEEVKRFFEERLAACLQASIKPENIWLDPGFGHGLFGKNLQENLLLLAHLKELKSHYPLLIGCSRKTFIGELLSIPIEERLPASLACAMIAAEQGVDMIRAHDVKATKQALTMLYAVNSIRGS